MGRATCEKPDPASIQSSDEPSHDNVSAQCAAELTARAESIRRIVDAAPPFTDEQRARLRPLLAGVLPLASDRAPAALPAPCALRTLAEIEAASAALDESFPPMTQERADLVAAILAPYLPRIMAVRATREDTPAVQAPQAQARRGQQVRHLTVDDLAERLRTTPENTRMMNSRRTGPKYMRIGKRCLYRLTDVEAWEESRIV